MKKEKVLINGISKIEYWTPTLNLRWLEQGLCENVHISYSAVKIRKLQQMFQGNLGSIEWRDVPTETLT